METKDNTKKLAVLIDAENVLPAHAEMIFDHAAALGDVVRREIFGASSALGAWVSPVLKYAIHPNLTIKASKGKNSSDIALVIGAMDLLVAGGVDSVIIASSDSDFSALSVRLRNAGIEVIGMGMEKSNELWRTACSTFVVLQNKPAASTQKQSAAQKTAQTTQKQPSVMVSLSAPAYSGILTSIQERAPPSSASYVTLAGTLASSRTRPSPTSLLRIRTFPAVETMAPMSGIVSGTTASCDSSFRIVWENTGKQQSTTDCFKRSSIVHFSLH